MTEIKIFYSWQSDLDANITRYLIQNAIKAAVKGLKNVVAIDADRDTKGELGSPNIETVIFDKIEQCDIFIADVSIVNKYTAISDDGKQKIRHTPNPNVMEELGFAAAKVGWSNVICFFNEDFGDEKLFPFDLRNHRITGFSLKETNRAEVVKELRNIISSHVMDLIENGPRQKTDNADHEIGCYDFSRKVIVNNLVSIDLTEHPLLHQLREDKNNEIKKLIKEIESIIVSKKEEPHEVALNDGKLAKYIGDLQPLAQEVSTSGFVSSVTKWLKKITIEDADKKRICEYTEKHLNMRLDESFFDLGDLCEAPVSIPGYGESLQGTEEEKQKHELIEKLTAEIIDVEIIDDYPKTFKDVKLFPLAIRNRSINPDKDLSITLEVCNCETVIPDRDLIADELKDGLEGVVCELELVKGLLELSDNGDISDRRGRGKYIPSWTEQQVRGLGGYYTPDPDEEDYEEEIIHYIESPVDGNGQAYRIEIPSLRPSEKSWVGIIAVKNNGRMAEISYRIQSDNTDGSIEGILMEVEPLVT